VYRSFVFRFVRVIGSFVSCFVCQFNTIHANETKKKTRKRYEISVNLNDPVSIICISRWTVLLLLVEEIRVYGENHLPVTDKLYDILYFPLDFIFTCDFDYNFFFIFKLSTGEYAVNSLETKMFHSHKKGGRRGHIIIVQTRSC
jgi:hypothetical protein